MNILELENKCKNFITKHIITSKTKGEKSILDLTRTLWPLFLKYNIDFDKFYEDYKNNKIVDVSFLENEGIFKWKDYINNEYKEIASELFLCRPAGLGTPNAQCGEGEFMLFVLSPLCKKPKKGDVEVNGSIKEFKDLFPRVYSKNTTGNEFRLKTLDILEKYKLTPFQDKQGRFSFPLTESKTQSKEAKNKEEFINNELSKLNKTQIKNLLKEYLVATNSFSVTEAEKSVKNIFIDGYVDRYQLQKEICKGFLRNQIKSTPGDNFLMFNGDVVVNIKYTIKSFEKYFDTDFLVPSSNYFRLFQSFPLAWYFKFNKNKIN